MASSMKSKLSRSRTIASCLVLGSCFSLAPPCWAGRDAGQMIAQDKANKEVIARRQAALDAAASAPETGTVMTQAATMVMKCERRTR